MTKEAQRIAFSKALGWHSIENSGLLNFPWSGYPPVDYIIGQKRQLPDCDDLNVVHEAEKELIEELKRDHCDWLGVIARWPSLATAQERTEALLRTRGMWVEEMVEVSAGK